MAREVFVLNCRRCGSEALLELGGLDGADHTVFRCRDCGFLFSPPAEAARAPGVVQSPLRPDGLAVGRRTGYVAPARRRPARDR